MKNSTQGKFIVIEGTDGSGKATQISLLQNSLENQNIRFELLDFPQYNEFWGKKVGEILSGKYGNLNSVSPYFLQPYLMLDQASRSADIAKWKESGTHVISNRYITSSLFHQVARGESKEEENEIRLWIETAGYTHLNMQREDLVLFLYVEPEISFELAKQSLDRKTYSATADILESNFEYQKKSAQIGLENCARYPHWKKITCTQDGAIRTREEIHADVKKTILDFIS